LPDILVTVVIPTLAADSRLLECVQSLAKQTRQDLEVIIVDNSGKSLVQKNGTGPGARVIENSQNVGFGAAINQGMKSSSSTYVATLNDDAVAHPRWLESLVSALDARPDAGMCASQVRLFGEDRLDSAGMLVARDGSSKQRGHGRMPEDFPVVEEVLMPSGSAALYRRTMLEELGGFDDSFFLYCEDTDLGLRARWAGWKCLYAPGAVVEHHYSHSAGRASPLKAYYVERNRLFVMVKNFPARMLAAAPLVSAARYFWHARLLLQGRGSAARFRAEGNAGFKMVWYIVKAHAAAVANLSRLWRQRGEIRSRARITPAVFCHLIAGHAISARKVAEL
jgi:GT2 family glycosyltransferase